MSQSGTILSVAPKQVSEGNGGSNWIILYQYVLDAGGVQEAQVLIGSGSSAAAALWSSPTATITVPNPPGTTNVPVTLPCPPLIQWAAFGIPLK